MPKNIILTGFMGTGKSLVSIELAKRMKRNRVSTDEMIERREGRSIPEIFAESGEAYFRKLEADVVREIAGKKKLIIDCGGGVVLNPENIRLLKENGIFFCFTSRPEVIFKRVKRNKQRPLLDTEDPLARIMTLIEDRKLSYAAAADFTIDTSEHTIEQTADEVMKLLPNERK